MASANFQRSKEEKDRDLKILEEARRREIEEKKRQKRFHSARHSRFGGTLVAQNVKAINDNNYVIVHKPLQSINGLDFDREKRPKKLARNKV